MPKARVTKVRLVGANSRGEQHAVNRIEGGNAHAHRRAVCPTCPWRKDAVGEFPAAAFKVSAPTCYDMAIETFACHGSGSKKPATCAGFLLSDSAQHNLTVRMKQRNGKLDLSKIRPTPGVELFATYSEMAVANGVDQNDPVLAPCR